MIVILIVFTLFVFGVVTYIIRLNLDPHLKYEEQMKRSIIEEQKKMWDRIFFLDREIKIEDKKYLDEVEKYKKE